MDVYVTDKIFLNEIFLNEMVLKIQIFLELKKQFQKGKEELIGIIVLNSKWQKLWDHVKHK